MRALALLKRLTSIGLETQALFLTRGHPSSGARQQTISLEPSHRF